MNSADTIINLGHQLSEERNAAHDLWTWLPTYKVAQKHHGDYASAFAPSVRDILVEASMYFAFLKDNALQLRAHTPDEKEWFGKCPCDEDHPPTSEEALASLAGPKSE